MRHVIILNGAPEVGKGVFSDMFGDAAETGSIINGSKQTARLMFGWNGEKDAKGRRLLFDIYNLSMKYNKQPLKEVVFMALMSPEKIAIIDVRDPDTIGLFKDILGAVGVPCTTVLIRRDDAEAAACKDGLSIDCRTADYVYDVELFNNGTLEDFESVIRKRFGDWLPMANK